jgi:hypothetical protein
MSAKVSPYPVNIGKMGEVQVLVRDGDREDAEEVLKKFREEPPDSLNQP